MPTYILRDLDAGPWTRFKERAHRDGWPLRPLFLQLMADYADGKLTLSKEPGGRPRQGYSELTCQDLRCSAGGRLQQVITRKEQVPAILEARSIPCPSCQAPIALDQQALEHLESWFHTSDPTPGKFGG
jgi:hypothetical protein